MKSVVLWKGIEYDSHEFAEIVLDKKGLQIQSTIIGSFGKKKYKVAYQVRADRYWNTRFVEITSTINQSQTENVIEVNRNGEWIVNGRHEKNYSGCIDIDISLTPFTNTLPIRRLALHAKEKKVIDVVLIDVLENNIRRVQQQYSRLSSLRYKFENVPNDFEAELKINKSGLVQSYPSLFELIR